MEIVDFRGQVRPGKKLSVEGEEFEVLQVIKFRLVDGSCYFKCFLSQDRVIAEDAEMNVYIFVHPVTTEFVEPMPSELEFDDKKFKFMYETHATAEEVFGEGEFEQGETERFWDYQADDKSYLSLGVNEKSNARADFYGKIVATEKVEIKPM